MAKPGSRKASKGSPASMGPRGGTRHGKQPHEGSSGLESLPGRLAKPSEDSHFVQTSSQGSSGPSPSKRLADACGGKPVTSKGKA